MSAAESFEQLLKRGSEELFADNPDMMSAPDLVPTPNVIDEGDLELFFVGVDEGLIELARGGRFNTLDRPALGGRWGLLSRSKGGGWFNAEYLPQLAAYVDAVLRKGFDRNRVLFELPGRALQLDLAILDDNSRVVVLGEAKREVGMLDKLVQSVTSRFSDSAPGPETKRRGDEARQLAWRLWTVRPDYLWLIAPAERVAYRCQFDPLRLDAVGRLPSAAELGLTASLPEMLEPPMLRG